MYYVKYWNRKDVKVGNYFGIGKNFKSLNRILTIDDELMMGEDVLFLGGGHNYENLEFRMGKQGNKPATPLYICSDVWIGARAIILPGCKRIGKGICKVTDYSLINEEHSLNLRVRIAGLQIIKHCISCSVFLVNRKSTTQDLGILNIFS